MLIKLENALELNYQMPKWKYLYYIASKTLDGFLQFQLLISMKSLIYFNLFYPRRVNQLFIFDHIYYFQECIIARKPRLYFHILTIYFEFVELRQKIGTLFM